MRRYAAIPYRRWLAVTSCILSLLAAPACTSQGADDAEQRAVNRADRFLRTADIGKTTLSFVHFGADYHGHAYQKTLPVRGEDGAPVDGLFKLVYRYHWENDGVTDVAYLCDRRGDVYAVQIPYSNAVLSQPFLLANGAIQILGNALIALYKDQMTENQRGIVQALVDKADAHGLLEWSLKFQQVMQS
jgi:hypothetical protein